MSYEALAQCVLLRAIEDGDLRLPNKPTATAAKSYQRTYRMRRATVLRLRAEARAFLKGGEGLDVFCAMAGVPLSAVIANAHERWPEQEMRRAS